MTLFIVQHRHEPDACVAGHPEFGPQLLAILAGASEAGVEIRAEAVVDGEHELNLIVDAANSETVVAVHAALHDDGVRLRPSGVRLRARR